MRVLLVAVALLPMACGSGEVGPRETGELKKSVEQRGLDLQVEMDAERALAGRVFVTNSGDEAVPFVHARVYLYGSSKNALCILFVDQTGVFVVQPLSEQILEFDVSAELQLSIKKPGKPLRLGVAIGDDRCGDADVDYADLPGPDSVGAPEAGRPAEGIRYPLGFRGRDRVTLKGRDLEGTILIEDKGAYWVAYEFYED